MVRGFAASAWSAITACSIGARRRNTTPPSRAFTRIIRDNRHCSQEASALRAKILGSSERSSVVIRRLHYGIDGSPLLDYATSRVLVRFRQHLFLPCCAPD